MLTCLSVMLHLIGFDIHNMVRWKTRELWGWLLFMLGREFVRRQMALIVFLDILSMLIIVMLIVFINCCWSHCNICLIMRISLDYFTSNDLTRRKDITFWLLWRWRRPFLGCFWTAAKRLEERPLLFLGFLWFFHGLL